MLVQGFDPLVNSEATLLILGTLPGRTSLQRNQYYADPKNAFWFIAHHLFEIDEAAPYEQRVYSLLTHGIAVWDVLRQAERDGSSDSKIVPGSEIPNDFGRFFGSYPTISKVFFNGGNARRLFRNLVTPTLPKDCALPRVANSALLSSSNSTFGYTREYKVQAWRRAFGPVVMAPYPSPRPWELNTAAASHRTPGSLTRNAVGCRVGPCRTDCGIFTSSGSRIFSPSVADGASRADPHTQVNVQRTGVSLGYHAGSNCCRAGLNRTAGGGCPYGRTARGGGRPATLAA
jgi:hypoxanthine-DNA glycosylase